MALTKTARLELINPYAKYGLKRRPTFDQIVGLVSENDKLIRPFPNREATRFRNSPQGSFFDGSDNLDLLKDQQTRILDRQMRENIMRKEAQQNGETLHLKKRQEQQTSGLSTPLSSESGAGFETPSSATSSIYHASFARHMEERLRREAERQEEVQNKHREGLNKLNQMMMHGMMRRGVEGLEFSSEKMKEVEEEDLPPLEDIPQDEPLDAEEEELPSNQRIVQNWKDDTTKILSDNTISFLDIMFQLFYRDLLSETIIDEVHKEPNNISKKFLLVGIVQGLIKDNKWNVMAEKIRLKQKVKEWINMKKDDNRLSNMSESSSSSREIRRNLTDKDIASALNSSMNIDLS